ncbi:MAG: hypothetical protein HOC34_03955 [Candidatus Magasanikbacteria bacterium]|nr:hypothetical protein [Candidatus Magasanikbacteria bacterium]
MRPRNPEHFLHQQDPSLHKEPIIEHLQWQREERQEKKEEQPRKKIEGWLQMWQDILEDAKTDQEVVTRMKQAAHELYVMKAKDVPDSFFVQQQRVARNEGREIPEITPELRSQAGEVIGRDQRASLDYWINYFSSSDAEGYPVWLKYWAFEGMKKLRRNPDAGDPEAQNSDTFIPRSKDTVAPYPELNQEALVYAMELLQSQFSKEYISLLEEKNDVKRQLDRLRSYDNINSGITKKEGLLQKEGIQTKTKAALEKGISKDRRLLERLPEDESDRNKEIEKFSQKLEVLEERQKKMLGYEDIDKPLEDIEELLSHTDFRTLYNEAFKQLVEIDESVLQVTKGTWVTYPKGSDHMKLVDSLQGKGTGWCTAGEGFASSQVAAGDFHVYYSEDENNEATIPRLAIRMKGNNIAEVRGRAVKQNIDSYMAKTAILGNKLTEFPDGDVYQKKDADMKQLTDIYKRHQATEPLSPQDLTFLYEINEKVQGFGYGRDSRVQEIIDNRRDRGIDIKEDLAFALQTKYPEMTKDKISTTHNEALNGDTLFHYGNLDLRSITSLEGVTLPDVGGNLDLRSITSLEGVTLSDVGGDLYLNSITSLEGVILPDIGGNLYLGSITSLEGVTLPDVGRDLNLRSITSLEGVTFGNVGGDLSLNSITSLEGVTLPDVGGNLDLRSITSLEGVTLPDVGGNFYLNSITSLEGVTFGDVGGSLDLRSITSLEGVTLPDVGRDLNLRSITSLEGVTFGNVGRDLYLNSITSLEGVTLPGVGGSLYLDSITSLEGVTLPDVGGSLYLNSITSLEGVTFGDVGRDLYLNSITSLEGVTLPDVDGNLYLGSITSLEGVTLPDVGGNLDLRSITSLEGVTLSDVGGSLNLRSITSLEGVTFGDVGQNLDLRSLPHEEKISLQKKYPNLNILNT